MSPVASCPMHAIHLWIVVLLAATYMHVPGTAIIVVPSSNCYLVGKEYEYHEQGSEPPDLVVEFCKDVQRRSQEVRQYDMKLFSTLYRQFMVLSPSNLKS